jgi:hypothetical protein
MPISTIARPSFPSATAVGSATWPSVLTWIPAGRNTTAAQPAIASDSSPPSGNPMNTFARSVARSRRVHRSSTPPEEKKNTSYGVIAAPNNAIA